MTDKLDDLSDAQSRDENRRYRGIAERAKSGEAGFTYLARWVPMGNWRMTGFDIVIMAFGVALILMVLGMRLFGVIGG